MMARMAAGGLRTSRRIGRVRILGAETTRYRITVDLRKRTRALHGPAAASTRRLIDLLGRPSLPADVWIGDDGLIRRERIAVRIPRPTDVAMSVTMDFVRYGVPVAVSAPPSAQVRDYGEVGPPSRRGD